MRQEEVMLTLSDDAARALRADLAGYTTDALSELLGPVAGAAFSREQYTPARRVLQLRAATTATDPASARLAILALAFLLGQPLPASTLAQALPQLGVAGAQAAGIISLDGDTARPAVVINPVDLGHGHQARLRWVASDLPEPARGGPLPAWHVLGVGGASLTLAGLLPPGDLTGVRAADIGTGCGIQALALAERGAEVIATDTSERALAFTAFNAALNDLPVAVRHGSLLEPLAGEEFDLVVANPPFVITPASVYAAGVPVMEYRDAGAGLVGDGLVASLVRDLPAVLRPGGNAVLLGNWERTGQDVFAAPRSWVDTSRADAWIIRRESLDPAEYAELWLRDGGLLPQSLPQAYEAYLDDFAHRGVQQIEFGYLLLHRTAGDGVVLTTDLSGTPAPTARDVHHLFAVRRDLERTDDDALAAARITASPDVTIEHHFRPGQSQPEVITLTQGGGLHQQIRATTHMAGLLGAADGELAVGQIAGALAALLEVDGQQMRTACCQAARELAACGMVRLDFVHDVKGGG